MNVNWHMQILCKCYPLFQRALFHPKAECFPTLKKKISPLTNQHLGGGAGEVCRLIFSGGQRVSMPWCCSLRVRFSMWDWRGTAQIQVCHPRPACMSLPIFCGGCQAVLGKWFRPHRIQSMLPVAPTRLPKVFEALMARRDAGRASYQTVAFPWNGGSSHPNSLGWTLACSKNNFGGM